MSAPRVGDALQADTTFKYIPYSPENADIKSCGIPISYNASKEWADKKVVLFAVPGAFTPTCSVRHLPDYFAKLPELRAKGVDIVAVLASNDPFVMSAWAKTSGIKDEIVFLSDADLAFSNKFGWAEAGRTNRYAIVLDKGIIKYAARETSMGDVSVSGVDNVLEQLE